MNLTRVAPFLITVAISTMPSWASGQVVNTDRLLDEIALAYESIESASVILVLEESADVLDEVSVVSDGRFSMRQVDGRETPAGVVFSYVDSKYLYADTPAGFTRTPLDSLPNVRIWWAGQWAAPWPMVPAWVRAIRRAEDVEIRLVGEKIVLGSPSLEMRLTFDRNHYALEQIETYSGTTIAFHGFDMSESPPMPSARQLVVDLPARGVNMPATTIESRSLYKELDLNPADIERQVRFDQRAVALDRYDGSSGNVYDAEGKKLYNYDEYAKEMIEQANRQASGLPPKSRGWSPGTWAVAGGLGGLAIAIAIGLIAWRRRS